jgi:hypothetical protein
MGVEIDTFLYPRLIRLSRPAEQAGVGFQPKYAADRKADETPVDIGGDPFFAQDVPASIQMRREGQRTSTGLPGDTTDPIWWVFIPLEAGIERGAIRAKDIVTDDCGVRYTVVSPYWDSLGWRLSVSTLAA